MGTLASELGPRVDRQPGKPRVYVDANVPAGVVRFMRRRLGWDTLFVIEHDDLRRAADEVHYRMARRLHRTLVTLDADFLDDRRFPAAESGGVVVLSAPNERMLRTELTRLDDALFRRGRGGRRRLRGRKLAVYPDWHGEL